MGDVNDLHDHLKNLIDKTSIPWTYAILWECSSQRRVLRFKDGYHRGSGKGKATDYDAATEWFFKISMNQYFEINEDLPGHALIAPTSVWINAEDRDADPRYKWGMWERTKLAHQFWIRTFFCLPLQERRALELASTQIMPINIQWIHHNLPLIYHHIGTLTRRQQQQQLRPYAVKQQVLRRIDERQLLRLRDYADELKEEAVHEMQNRGKEKISDSNRNDKRLRERTDNEMQNRGKKKISDDSNRNDKSLHERADNEMQNRGKEKISESTCSWSLLTESSDTCIGTDTTFSCSHDYSGPS